MPAIRSLSSLAITAVSARTQPTADAAAKVFGARYAFSDAEALALCPDVDLVVVCVRVPLHRQVVLAAIAAGKHVYCEWPLGRTLAETKELRDAATKKSIRHVIGLQGRTHPAIEAAAKLVSDGRLGRVLSARIISTSRGWGAKIQQRYAYTADVATGATLLSITTGHSLDSLCHVLGDIDSVSAMLVTQRTQVCVAESGAVIEQTSPDNALLNVRHRSGCVTSVSIGGGCPRFGGFVFDIMGEKGELRISADQLGDFQIAPLTLTGYTGDQELKFLIETPASTPSGSAANVSRVYQRLLTDLKQGTTTAPSFDDAVKLGATLEAVQRSSDHNQSSQQPSEFLRDMQYSRV